MRRTTLLAVVGGALLSLGVGVAVARDISCDGGRCVGTDRPDRMVGTDGHDAIFALGNRDQVDGEDGNDDLSGDGGPDSLCAGGGSDTAFGGKRPDVIGGDFDGCVRSGATGPEGNGPPPGHDDLSGGGGADFIGGGRLGDRIHGDNGADILGQGAPGTETIALLFGEEGDDKIRGGKKADGIEGGPGNDRLFGNDGNDHIRADDEDGGPRGAGGGGTSGDQDFVDCGDGFDRAIVNQNDEVRHCERVLRRDGGGGSQLDQALEAVLPGGLAPS